MVVGVMSVALTLVGGPEGTVENNMYMIVYMNAEHWVMF